MDEAAIYNKALSEGQLHSHALVAFGGAGAPVFVYDPPVAAPSATVMAGTTFTLTSDAYGAPALAFQWRHAGTNLTGATAASLTKANVTLRDAGNYTVVVTNSSGSITGTPVAMTILDLPANATNDLRLWLKLDETAGTVAANSSTNVAVSGALVGFPGDDTQWVQGAMGRALRVNPPGSASIQYVSVTDDSTLNFYSSMEFSVALWVKASPSGNEGKGIIAKGEGAGGEQFALDVNAGAYRFFVRDGGGAATVYQTSVAPNNNWQHITAVFSVPLGLVKVYVDGSQVMSGAPPSSLLHSTHEVSVGARQSGYGDYDLALNGTIDDVRIYARMLSQSDVTLLYTNALPIRLLMDQQPQPAAAPPVLPGGSATFTAIVSGSPIAYQWQHDGVNVPGATNATLVLSSVDASQAGSYILIANNSVNSVTSSVPATVSLISLAPVSYEAGVVADKPESYWRLNEATTGVVTDSMGRHNGATTGAVAVSQPGALAGEPDTSLSFSANWVGVPYSPGLNTPSLSFECWVSPDVALPLATYYCPISSRDGNYDTGGHNKGYNIYAAVVGNWDFWMGREGANWLFCNGTVAVHTNVWTHLICTCDYAAHTQRIYVNGVLSGELITSYDYVPNLRNPFYIGTLLDSGPYHFYGAIDEVSFYQSVLSPERVKAHYELGVYGTNNLPIFIAEPASQTVVAGKSLSFNPVLAGATPMTYQWKQDGADVTGGTSLALGITTVDYANAGQYTLAATNGYGGAVSAAATLVVAPPASVTNLTLRISSTQTGTKLELIWPLGHTLYYKTDLAAGTWLPVSGASAPYYNVPINTAIGQLFFKLQ
jgi:hypothetical protein